MAREPNAGGSSRDAIGNWARSATGPDLQTGGIEGAFWPVRQKVARGAVRAAYDGADWFVVPITLAWLRAFVEKISPDRDNRV